MKKLWLTRDTKLDPYDRQFSYKYCIFEGYKIPTISRGKYQACSAETDIIRSFCAEPFERIAYVKLKPGECREIKSIKFTFADEKTG